MKPPKLDYSIPVSEMPIYRPAVVRLRGGAAQAQFVLPVIMLDNASEKSLLAFADEVTPTWPASAARRRTPKLLRPGAFDIEEQEGDHEAVARSTYRSIAVPQFQAAMMRRPVGLSHPGGRVLERWWRRRLAKNRNLDLARVLRDARNGHRQLRAAFGSLKRRGLRFSPVFDRERRARAAGREPDDLPQREWHRLSEAVIRLVTFDRWYAETPPARYAYRFADRTDMAGRFFRRYGRAIATRGVDSRKLTIDARRWALCLYVWSLYVDQIAVDWTWGRTRHFLRDVIWTHELIARGHPPDSGGPETVMKWLRENGW